MARRSFMTGMVRLSRELERQAAARQREIARRQRELEREQAYRRRQSILTERERKRLYIEDQIAQAEELTAEAEERMEELQKLLTNGLSHDPTLDLMIFRREYELPEFDYEKYEPSAYQPKLEQFVPKRSFFARLLPGAKKRLARRIEAATKEYEDAVAVVKAEEEERATALRQAKHEHETECVRIRKEVDEHNAGLAELQAGVVAGKPQAVSGYFSLLLQKIPLLENFESKFDIGFVPDSKNMGIIPLTTV